MSTGQNSIVVFIIDEAKKWTARTAIAACVGGGILLLTPLNERLSAIWRSPDQLAEISGKLDSLAAELQKASGEDRVIFEAPGLSYVREPVHIGEDLTLSLVVRRTRTGAACTLLTRTAIYTDETNISSAGETLRPARQIGNAETAVRISLAVPEQVQAGRVTVSLSLEFDCGGKKVFDTTRPVAFALLPAPTQ